MLPIISNPTEPLLSTKVAFATLSDKTSAASLEDLVTYKRSCQLSLFLTYQLLVTFQPVFKSDPSIIQEAHYRKALDSNKMSRLYECIPT